MHDKKQMFTNPYIIHFDLKLFINPITKNEIQKYNVIRYLEYDLL